MTNLNTRDIINTVVKSKPNGEAKQCDGSNGSIAQLGEHLPYKQRVIGSSPIVSTSGPVAQLVRALACHARGRGFDPHPDRHYNTALAVCLCSSVGRAGD